MIYRAILLTITRPLPLRASPICTLAGRRFIASRLFRWYSSSNVSAAIPFPLREYESGHQIMSISTTTPLKTVKQCYLSETLTNFESVLDEVHNIFHFCLTVTELQPFLVLYRTSGRKGEGICHFAWSQTFLNNIWYVAGHKTLV
jgi:hypothetical protein